MTLEVDGGKSRELNLVIENHFTFLLMLHIGRHAEFLGRLMLYVVLQS